MRRRFVALAAGIATLAAAPLPAQQRHALLVGIDRYSEVSADAYRRGLMPDDPLRGRLRGAGDFQRGRITDLGGAAGDAQAMRDVLTARYGFDAANVRLLLDGAATRAAILRGIADLAARASAGDVVVFYYAGHGSQRVNSRNGRGDALDQTLVPADANAGVFDIRDKELARAFAPLLAKGVTLTVLVDACHSGTITRGEPAAGRSRWAAVDSADAGDAAPIPEVNAQALVFSAATDDQPAMETRGEDGAWHGAFTWALVKTLMSASPAAPASEVALQVKAILQAEQPQQEPVLEAPAARLTAALLDGGTSTASGRVVVPVLRRVDETHLELQGGRAIGLRRGSVLRRAGGDERVRVLREIGTSRVEVEVMSGTTEALRPGMLFDVTAWGAGDDPALQVWVPTSLPDAEIGAVAREIDALRALPGVTVAEDPTTEVSATQRVVAVRREGAQWVLRRAPGEPAQPLGRRWRAADVANAAGITAAAPAVVHVNVPPPASLDAALRLGAETAYAAVTRVTNPDQAHYVLSGRIDGERGASYAWVQPGAVGGDAATRTLPPRTAWVPAGDAPRAAAAADSLARLALAVGRVRTWLTLTSPPAADGEGFPYRLAFRVVGGEVVRDTLRRTRGGDIARYVPVLQLDSAVARTAPLTRWFVTLAIIDASGASTVICPGQRTTTDNVIPTQGATAWPAEIVLDQCPFRVAPPYGTDTWVLLASRESVPREALQWGSVRSAEQTRGRGGALAQLLARKGAATRGAAEDVAPDVAWSLQRVPMRSLP